MPFQSSGTGVEYDRVSGQRVQARWQLLPSCPVMADILGLEWRIWLKYATCLTACCRYVGTNWHMADALISTFPCVGTRSEVASQSCANGRVIVREEVVSLVCGFFESTCASTEGRRGVNAPRLDADRA